MIFLIISIVVFLYLLYKYLTANYGYWKKWKVPHPKPTPPFGNFKDMVLMKKSLAQQLDELYKNYPGATYIGFYKIRTPCLMLTNLEHIQNVLGPDYKSFWRHELIIDEETDPIAARGPFFQTGQKWKDSRALFSAVITPAKLKHLCPLMVQATVKMIDYIEKRKTCEGRDLLSRYSADASALTAFGVDGESFDKDDAYFRKLGQQVMEPDGFTPIRLLCIVLFPSIARALNFKFIPDDTVDYARQVVAKSLKYRKENNIKANDFLDVLMSLKSEKFNDEDVFAFSLGFFSDPNVAIAGSYVLFELAANLEIQEKLRHEIRDVLSRHQNELTYDAVQDMAYLNCIVQETLRMHSPIQFSMKRCTGYYEFPAIDQKSEVIPIEPGMSVAIPIYNIHHDEKYYENPSKFDPERFSEKNRGKLVNGAYLPFGDGQRICPGQRMANIFMKIAVVSIIQNFDITVSKKTKLPLEPDPKFVLRVMKGGLWLDFQKRDNN